MSRRRRALAVAGVVLITGGVLAALSHQHPGLRLVDFISFSTRGQRVWAGLDLVHPLYPVGYPALVGLLQGILGDPILAGRLVSGAAGALLAGVVAHSLGAGAGLWVLGLPVVLTFGATEGTDLLAAAWCLAALFARDHRRPALAGSLAAMACLTRYTGLAVLLAVWIPPRDTRLSRDLPRLLGAFVLCTAPHWAVALATGTSMVPDSSLNMSIGANARVDGLGWDVLARWPGNVAAAWAWVSPGPGVGVGLAGLIATATAPRAWAGRAHLPDKPRQSVRLLVYGAAHLGLVALAFANTRLVLPTRLAWSLGVAVALSRYPKILAGAAILLCVWTLPAAWPVSAAETRLAGITAALADLDAPLSEAHFLTTDPWVYRVGEGVLQPGLPVREVGGDPRALRPRALADFARLRGHGLVVVDVGRVQRTYPALAPMLDTEAPEVEQAGLTLVTRAPGYRVYAVQQAVLDDSPKQSGGATQAAPPGRSPAEDQ